MNIAENVVVREGRCMVEPQKQDTCVMLDDNGQEVNITKDMVVSVCQELLNQCRNIQS
ncbi:PA1571 family protein [Acinetobacter rudis]|uniref:Uncharacterized protein n=1 Tax=Acinetobacter rudis TaxID=632955 RepID=A0AAW8JAW3_9GAMM|nr:PA1571 family protein [Acinetobacter rudis]MDQ8936803.1 hypothetical protein [Acinetobacter rudis]MDQ8953204.1 hypothetical protein [Acinetobacter rudis]MDQ9019015.1 hypothetical protein [Acinetobacter rudis]